MYMLFFCLLLQSDTFIIYLFFLFIDNVILDCGQELFCIIREGHKLKHFLHHLFLHDSVSEIIQFFLNFLFHVSTRQTTVVVVCGFIRKEFLLLVT